MVELIALQSVEIKKIIFIIHITFITFIGILDWILENTMTMAQLSLSLLIIGDLTRIMASIYAQMGLSQNY